MSKKLCISIPEYLLELYIPKDCRNRSEYFQKLITLGATSMIKNPAVLENQMFKMRETNAELAEENRSLKIAVAKLKDFNSEIRSKERAALREAKRRERLHLRTFIP